jgi:hypothetical protein
MSDTELRVSSLRSQLENYRLIVDVNQELFEKHITTRDELATKLVAAQGFVEQLEKTVNQVDYSTTQYPATKILNELDVIIKRVLSQETV